MANITRLSVQGEEGSGASTPAEGVATPDLDFSDLKKKKKKKEIPLDLGEDSGTSTPVAKEGEDGAAAPAEDLDFSDLRKKKKSTKKKAQLDLEAFERELGEATGDGAHLDQLEEHELGEDVFAHDGETGGAQAGAEPWLGSDRDYTYQEVRPRPIHSFEMHISWKFSSSFFIASIISSMLRTRLSYRPLRNDTLSLRRRFIVTGIRRQSLPTLRISRNECIDHSSTLYNSCWPRWEQLAL